MALDGCYSLIPTSNISANKSHFTAASSLLTLATPLIPPATNRSSLSNSPPISLSTAACVFPSPPALL